MSGPSLPIIPGAFVTQENVVRADGEPASAVALRTLRRNLNFLISDIAPALVNQPFDEAEPILAPGPAPLYGPHWRSPAVWEPLVLRHEVRMPRPFEWARLRVWAELAAGEKVGIRCESARGGVGQEFTMTGDGTWRIYPDVGTNWLVRVGPDEDEVSIYIRSPTTVQIADNGGVFTNPITAAGYGWFESTGSDFSYLGADAYVVTEYGGQRRTGPLRLRGTQGIIARAAYRIGNDEAPGALPQVGEAWKLLRGQSIWLKNVSLYAHRISVVRP